MAGLSRHVPELALEWMTTHAGARWRAIDGTLCFADVSGFTALAERLAQRGRAGGEELVETLSRVFGSMLDLARERGGGLLKFGGDALLLFFGREDHAIRAAGCAVEMQRALRRAAELPTSVGPLNLSMSVGLHSGPVDFFLVGRPHRELVVLGPAATRVVEVEGAAQAREVAVSAETAALLPGGALRMRADGVPLVRWRKAPATGCASALPERADALARELFPRALGDALAGGPPEPEHRVACIAFLRFSGTDALLSREGPHFVARALDETLATIQRCFDEEQVTLLAVDVDRDGGKVFAGAGVPSSLEDDEGAMLRALRRILDLGTPLPLQIGVSRGHVFAAEVGTPRRAAYSAMGDTTNTAARIAAKAPVGALYAHPSVLDYSFTLFEATPAGPFSFKGKKVPQIVHAVGEERGTRTREGVAGFALVGRSDESRALASALNALRSGTGGVLSLVGASGLGKSRLLHDALAGWSDAALVSVRAEPYGAASPYRVFRDPLRALLGIERGAPDAMRTALEGGVARTEPSLQPVLALLGDVAHVEIPPSPEVAALDPRYRPERTADAVIQLLARARRGPLVLVAEDAHWADQASAHLLERIARACSEQPWLLLVARRDQAGGFEPKDAVELRLAPLADDAIRALAIEATEAAPLRPHALELLVRRAGGNPLFALEILRAAREVGSLEAVPDSLEAALTARVDALDSEARQVLRHASVLGRSFSLAAVSDVLRDSGAALGPRVLARLGEFIVPDGETRLRFRNGLLRDAIYGGLAFRQRARLHRVAGAAIERAARDVAASADVLALHFSMAGDHGRAWRYARLAADRARRSYANADAARLYELAIDAGRRLASLPSHDLVQVWSDLGDVRELAGLFEGSLAAYQHAAQLAGDEKIRRAALLFGQARARERSGRFSSALRDLTRGCRLLEGDPSPDAAKSRARLLSFAAMVRWGQERAKQALQTADLAAAAARGADEPTALARALVVHDLASMVVHGPGDGAAFREALAIYESLGDLRMQGNVHGNMGFMAAVAGRWDEARAAFGAAQTAYERSGDSIGASLVAMNLGELLVKQGRMDEAEPILEAARRTFRSSNFSEYAAMTEIQLGRVSIARGELEAAAALLDQSVRELEQLGKTVVALEAVVVRAQALVLAGRADEALKSIERASAAPSADARLIAPLVSWGKALALTALDRLSSAESEIQVGLASARSQGLLWEEAMLLRARCDVALRRGHEPTVEDAASANRIFRTLGVRRDAS